MTLVLQAAIVLTAVLAALAPVSAPWIERRFSTTVYPAIQAVVTPLSNTVPFAVFDVLTLGAAVLLIAALVGGVRGARRERRARPLLIVLWRVTTAAAVVYLAFLAVWGLNYRRPRMAERLVMDRPAPRAGEVMALALDAARQLNTLHTEAHRTGWIDDLREDRTLLDAYGFVQRRLSEADLAVPGRLKRSVYGPYFRWTSVDGMVNPFALEVLENPDLLPFERPFVAAHEWAHLAGYAHEAEANFVGWLTCVRAAVPSQYSAWVFLFWQIYGEVGTAERMTLWEALAEGPRRDIEAMLDRLRRGQLPVLRRASWAVYDRYLRANRVEGGVRAYGEVVTLLLRARFEDGWGPVRRTSSSR